MNLAHWAFELFAPPVLALMILWGISRVTNLQPKKKKTSPSDPTPTPTPLP